MQSIFKKSAAVFLFIALLNLDLFSDSFSTTAQEGVAVPQAGMQDLSY